MNRTRFTGGPQLTSGLNCCNLLIKRGRVKLSLRPGYTTRGTPNVPTTGCPAYSRCDKTRKLLFSFESTFFQTVHDALTMPVSGPRTMASWPSALRWSRRRASVRVTPSTFGRKFSVHRMMVTSASGTVGRLRPLRDQLTSDDGHSQLPALLQHRAFGILNCVSRLDTLIPRHRELVDRSDHWYLLCKQQDGMDNRWRR